MPTAACKQLCSKIRSKLYSSLLDWPADTIQCIINENNRKTSLCGVVIRRVHRSSADCENALLNCYWIFQSPAFLVQFSEKKVKDPGYQTPKTSKIQRYVHLQAVAQEQSAPTADWFYAIVRPSSLSAPEHETVGNCTDGRTTCRHSAAACSCLSCGKNV